PSGDTGEGAGRSVSLSDTVGFIRDLPHGLVAAFEATLQEAVDADLLLHVVDAANPNHPEQIAEVQRVLAEIGAADVPQMLVFNKIDALPDGQQPRHASDLFELDGATVPRVFVSSRSGKGLAELRRLLADLAAARVAAPVPESPELHEDPA
ncbi:MAG: hflX, partial [Ramlibacter sp.]|nr:hflX [Ramlibacter sp.]